MAFSVYVVTHLATGRRYFGKARDPRDRWRRHLRGDNPRSFVQRALRKHGRESFSFEVVEDFASEAEAYRAESWWVLFARSNDERFGFNLSAGGEGNPGAEVGPATRKLLSEVSKRRWARPGERERNAEQTRRVHTGLKRSPETCRRISEALAGHETSAEHRAKLSAAEKGVPRPYVSAALSGRKKSADHVAKVAAAHRGTKRSEEARANMRAAHARRKALAG